MVMIDGPWREEKVNLSHQIVLSFFSSALFCSAKATFISANTKRFQCWISILEVKDLSEMLAVHRGLFTWCV